MCGQHGLRGRCAGRTPRASPRRGARACRPDASRSGSARGVVNSHRTACAAGRARSPAATPAGTSTRYVVAIGKRPVGSNSSVRVPTHRHFPGGSGVRRTGTPRAARSSWEPTGTIGCENVMLRCEASGHASLRRAPDDGHRLRPRPRRRAGRRRRWRRERLHDRGPRPRRRQRALAEREGLLVAGDRRQRREPIEHALRRLRVQRRRRARARRRRSGTSAPSERWNTRPVSAEITTGGRRAPARDTGWPAWPTLAATSAISTPARPRLISPP